MPSPIDYLKAAHPDEFKAASSPRDEALVLGQTIRDAPNTSQDNELDTMQDNADLLTLIRQDTGEDGSGSGETIYFKSCPICGHKDCFRYYPATNSWACFGGSNDNAGANGHDGGRYIRYLLRTNKARNDAEAVMMLREATGNLRGPRRQGERTEGNAETAGGTEVCFTPERLDGNQLLSMAEKEPDWLLRGVYARGDVVLITGLSGLGKTHLAMEMCFAHATHGEVLGHVAERAHVIVVDPEMRPDGLARRARGVSDHYRATNEDLSNIKYLFTRVAPRGLGDIGNMLAASDHRPDVLILDSISVIAAMDDLDENSNPDVTRFLIRLKELAKRYDCAVIAMHHPPKNAGMAYANAGTLIRGAEAWRSNPDNVFELLPLKVEEGTGAWELRKTYSWQGVDEFGERVTRYPRAVRLQCTKFRYEYEPRPVNMLFRPPIHIVDASGELRECPPAFDRPSDKGGAATKKNAEQRRESEEEALYAIVHELESQGTEPTSEVVAERLNQWRRESGSKRSISADTLERYTTEGKKRKYYTVSCVDGIFKTGSVDALDGTRLALSDAG